MFSQILLIGGSDSSGLAGLQADKAICQHYSVTSHIVTTSVTIQDSEFFYNRFDQDCSIIAESIVKILDNNPINYVKIGMLANLNIAKAVYDIFKNRSVKLVLDPVFKSTSGGSLLDENATGFVKNELLPICYVITPNINEANTLLNTTILGVDQMLQASYDLKRLGAKNVIIKGGHLDDAEFATDILNDADGQIHKEETERVNKNIRGSGCKFATSIACNLAMNKALKSSFITSKNLITSLYKA